MAALDIKNQLCICTRGCRCNIASKSCDVIIPADGPPIAIMFEGLPYYPMGVHYDNYKDDYNHLYRVDKEFMKKHRQEILRELDNIEEEDAAIEVAFDMNNIRITETLTRILIQRAVDKIKKRI